MDIRLYTDDNYVPLKDLAAFGDDFVARTTEYRRMFMEMVSLNGLDFVNIVETPSLVKKRYTKNVAIKGFVDIDAENNDFILEIAKALVMGTPIKGISFRDREQLVTKYKENSNDLTIITSYITRYIEQFVSGAGEIKEDWHRQFPAITRMDLSFIAVAHDIALYYAINDYQVANACSYETGRKALDKLAALYLYRKTKIGKRFLYQPTERLVQMVKGGEKHGY